MEGKVSGTVSKVTVTHLTDWIKTVNGCYSCAVYFILFYFLEIRSDFMKRLYFRVDIDRFSLPIETYR